MCVADPPDLRPPLTPATAAAAAVVTVLGLSLLALRLRTLPPPPPSAAGGKEKRLRRGRPRPRRRRTSTASTVQIDRPLMERKVGMRQNMVNAVLDFGGGDGDGGGGAPSRDDMVAAMGVLAARFERMRSRPRKCNGCGYEWVPIEDLGAAVQRAVVEEDPFRDRNGDDGVRCKADEEAELQRVILRRVEDHKARILLDEDEGGKPMPLWRVVILRPSTVLVRIDHSIGDGLTLVTLLQEVGTCADTGRPLQLGDMSPLLRRVQYNGDARAILRPLALLWPLNLWRALTFLSPMASMPDEASNPLRPPPKHFLKPISPSYSGTVYLPTISLGVFRALARAAGDKTTINEVMIFCLADAVRRYFDRIGAKNHGSIRLVLPVANPIRPSWYGDEFEGLCNHVTPLIVPLNVSDQLRTRPLESLDGIRRYLDRLKRSNAPLLLTVMNTVFDRIVTPEHAASGAAALFRRASCIYSNVPGPTRPVSVAGRWLRGVQVLMPHPVSIFQALSYNGRFFFNINLDTRSAERPWLLRGAFVEAIRSFASTWGATDEVRMEIEMCADSSEWGGKGIVFTCSN